MQWEIRSATTFAHESKFNDARPEENTIENRIIVLLAIILACTTSKTIIRQDVHEYLYLVHLRSNILQYQQFKLVKIFLVSFVIKRVIESSFLFPCLDISVGKYLWHISVVLK